MKWDAFVAKLAETEPASFVRAVKRMASSPDEPAPRLAKPRKKAEPKPSDDRMTEVERAARERACEAAYGDGQLHRWEKPGER